MSVTARDIAVLAAALVATAATVALLRLIHGVSPTTVGLALLLVVLVTATLGRLWIAVVIAIVATAAFNFYFFAPVGTFTIADPHNWIAVMAFLIVAGVVAIVIERTQFLREREAAELVRQKADLAATLLASLSHDLKTPLTAISVAVENLTRDLPGDERRAQAAAATAELERLTRLFEDILDMARIDSSAIQVDRQWVTPADVVDAAVAQVRHALDGHVVRVDADAETLVQIDPRVTSMALSHLLENAAQYSPSDRDIAVEASADIEGLRVAVTDGGPGLDSTEIAHLFERFYRGKRARQLAPGTGMGLAITRGLLAALGGRVWGENTAGAGARFTIVVPAPRRRMATGG